MPMNRKKEKDIGQTTSPYHPPSDEDDDNDDDDIFLKSISKPSKDYSREPMAGKKKLNSSQTSSPSSPGKGSNSSSPFTKISSHLASPKKRGRPPKPMEDGETVTKKATPKKRPSTGGSTAVPGKKSRSDMSFLSLNLYNSFQAHLAQKGETTKKDIKPTEKRIGFIGLGLMGTGMAMNLIKAGHKVTVWNRTSEKVRLYSPITHLPISCHVLSPSPSMGGSTAVPGKKSRSDMSFLSLNLYNSFQAHLAQKGETTKKDIKPTEKKIGFIGLGLMGTGMAMNLIKAGHKVTVWNRTSEKVRLYSPITIFPSLAMYSPPHFSFTPLPPPPPPPLNV
eukprot:XP_011665070.1 PREDICTED: putative oxidoreductase GLYR1 [Strongylocentrotus purpuratus]